MNCVKCGAHLEGSQLYCGRCGVKIDWDEVSPPPVPPVSLLPKDEVESKEIPPLLQTWKTSIGFSLLGAAAGFIGYGILFEVMIMVIYHFIPISFEQGGSPFYSIVGALLLLLICFVPPVIYAATVYTSLFTEKPKITSTRVISFLNLFFGSLILWGIFGLLMNRSLTKKKRGYVDIAFTLVFVLFSIFAFIPSSDGTGSYYSSKVPEIPIKLVELHPYSSAEYGFTVSFPGHPVTTQDELVIEGLPMPCTTYESKNNEGSYLVRVEQYPRTKRDVASNPRDQLLNKINGVAEASGSPKHDWHNTGEVCGNPCASVVLGDSADNERSFVYYCTFFKEGTAYTFVATGIGEEDFDSFVQSFRFDNQPHASSV